MRRPSPWWFALAVLALGLAAIPARLISRPAIVTDFVHFESGHVHPVAITPDGTRLLVVNTPDNRLSVFDLTGAAPARIAEIPVGLEPVSVAARNNGEAWVVNHLSDDVSVVDLGTLHTRATLRVGDEPSDVVFAAGRAYVSVSQEDAVKSYDPANLGAAPILVPIPGRMPRAMATSAGGAEVLVNVFHSSGGATVLSASEAGDSLPPPNPPMATGLPPAPRVGLIVKRGPTGWLDEAGHLWNSKIPYQVPKVELVYVSTATQTVLGTRGDMATTMMGIATSPLNGTAAVTGTHAFVEKRFEPNLRGRFTEQRLALVPGRTGPITTIHLNQGFDYTVTPGPPSESDSAVGIPTGVCWAPDGQRVYVTSLASNKVAVYDALGTRLARVATIAGPTGIVADPARARLYVVGRFRNQLQTLSTASLSSVAVASIGFDPTPDPIVNGRKFFYGGFTSGHGDQACASCHLFGDLDNLAWDLGDPRGSMAPPPPGMIDPFLRPFHPMKGPMATQTLRGLPGTGVLHWRGDREDLSAFNAAFVGLMGRSAMLPDSEMAAFSDFVLPLVHPPNPAQYLDRNVPDAPFGQPSARRGRFFFLNTPVDGSLTCAQCHSLPSGTNGQLVNAAALQESQDMKIPQLRNMYRKTGFNDSPGAVNKRGFGFTHDGAVDDLFTFLQFPGFNFGTGTAGDANRRDMERFLLAFDTGMSPAVGHQITFDGTNNGNAALQARMDTLEAQADGGHCQLVAKGRIGTMPRGWVYELGGPWRPDISSEATLTRSQLIALATAGHEVTITGVPPGTGQRLGIDRDRDGFFDGDELATGFDPGDPASHPIGDADPGRPMTGLRSVSPNPFRAEASVRYALAQDSDVALDVHDLLGRRVRSLERGPRRAGSHAVVWDGRLDDGRAAPGGVYFVRLRAGASRWQHSVVRIR